MEHFQCESILLVYLKRTEIPNTMELTAAFTFLKNKFIYLFIFCCIGSSLLHEGFLQLQRAGATLRCGARASYCGGFSCCGAQALGAWASRVVARGLSNCGTRAQLLHGMWHLPGPGLEPMSPALAGGFLITALRGKPSIHIFKGKPCCLKETWCLFWPELSNFILYSNFVGKDSYSFQQLSAQMCILLQKL